jgi:ABC-2 type transport system ATP-binding protein
MLAEIVFVVAAPLILASWLGRRWRMGWGLFGVGALAFVASQVVHLPLNWALAKMGVLGRGVSLPVVAVVLGVSAGVCEECARWIALKKFRPDARSGPQAAMFGAGHGGVESILTGLVAAWSLYQVTAIERLGVERVVLDPTTQQVVRAQLAAFEALPGWMPLLAALERAMVIPFHVAASMLVARAVVERRASLVVAAIGFHALLDAGTVWVGGTLGPMWAEAWVAAIVPISALVIRSSARALPNHDDVAPVRGRPKSADAPLELAMATKSYGSGDKSVHALKSASFVIPKGERVCLLGPNGAGKTTAIRMLTGAIAPTHGWAFLYGAASDEPAFLAAKRRVGIVPQQPGMYEELDTRQWLELVRALYGRGDVDAMAKSMGLESFLDRPMSKLSGGMQRRVCIAAALLAEPELLILDEPSAGLDPVAAREVIDHLESVSRDRTTLLCTHNLAEAEELCDSVVILRGGEVLVHESIAKLRDRIAPKIELRAVQGAGPLARAIDALGHASTTRGDTVTLTLPDAEKAVATLLRALLADGLDVCECHVHRASLEDLFLQIVRGPR